MAREEGFRGFRFLPGVKWKWMLGVMASFSAVAKKILEVVSSWLAVGEPLSAWSTTASRIIDLLGSRSGQIEASTKQ